MYYLKVKFLKKAQTITWKAFNFKILNLQRTNIKLKHNT